jgi:hypothetical protein
MDVAERVAALSDIVAEAGVTDVIEGAELLTASEDVEVQSAIISLMADGDLAESMDIAAISGQLFAVSEVMDAIDMPVLAAFLETKGEQLHEIAVDTIFRYSATRALGDAMAETGRELDAMGEREVAEGADRMAAAEGLAESSEDMAAEGVERAAHGLAEMAAAQGMHEAAEELALEGAAEAAAGAARIGAADAISELAASLEEEMLEEGDEAEEEDE